VKNRPPSFAAAAATGALRTTALLLALLALFPLPQTLLAIFLLLFVLALVLGYCVLTVIAVVLRGEAALASPPWLASITDAKQASTSADVGDIGKRNLTSLFAAVGHRFRWPFRVSSRGSSLSNPCSHHTNHFASISSPPGWFAIKPHKSSDTLTATCESSFLRCSFERVRRVASSAIVRCSSSKKVLFCNFLCRVHAALEIKRGCRVFRAQGPPSSCPHVMLWRPPSPCRLGRGFRDPEFCQ
jgi:hypothetical protein